MKVLIDSDALFALFVADDVHHRKAKTCLGELLATKNDMFVTNLVVQETATVLSYKIAHAVSLDFLQYFEPMPVNRIFVTDKLDVTIWEIFKRQKGDRISWIDCSNIAVCQAYELDGIFSFDAFYRSAKLRCLPG